MQTSIQYRFQLDGSRREAKRKIDCPLCKGKRSFTRYKDYETGEYIDDSVGYCDRANKCTYHMKPKEWFAMHPNRREENIYKRTMDILKPKPRVHIPFEVLNSSLKNYENNSFVQALLNFFPVDKIENAIADYYLGTAQSLTGANESVIFWFIDHNNNIRAGQVKEFDKTCKTLSFSIGDDQLKAYWIHRLLKKFYKQKGTATPEWLLQYIDQDMYLTCLFGEHLLNLNPNKTVCLVEAPKTAVIASIVYPEYVWLATTSLTYLTKERCRVLKGRNVVLFPDCGIPSKTTGLTCLDIWRERLEDFKDIAFFAFSTLLEEAASIEQKEAGFDLADFILEQHSKPFIEIAAEDIQSMPVITKTGEEYGGLILAFVKLKDGRCLDILYSKEGELITTHPSIGPLSLLFEKSFTPGKLDGQDCLFNNAINQTKKYE